MQETTFAQLEKMFLALGDKTRLRLLALMADGPVAVGFLADRLNESQPKVSRHLAYLRNAGMVTTTRDGKWIYYGIRYPQDAARRRLLESLISTIAVVRVDGRDVYLAETSISQEDVPDIYELTDMNEIEDGGAEGVTAENIETHDEGNEMDVFML